MKTDPRHSWFPVVFFAAGLLSACHPGTPVPLYGLVVNTTDDLDDGTCDKSHCSLREAINKANTYEKWVTISFHIGDGGPQSIHVLSPLPLLAYKITIDGTSQPGYAGSPMIELDGSALGDGSGLNVTGDGTEIKGLIINRFPDYGILINAEGFKIQGNYIGTNASGAAAAGNGSDGIRFYCSDLNELEKMGGLIGGSSPEERNVISGNGSNGVRLEDFTCGDINTYISAYFKIQGNYIGTDATGTVALGNNQSGIFIDGLNENTVGGNEPGQGNVISGNGENGIFLRRLVLSVSTTVMGNYIGTDALGAHALGNGQNGINIEGGSAAVGGSDEGSGNLISGNPHSGVNIKYGDVVVAGNQIGTDKAGTAALANGTGIRVQTYQGQTVVIGGAAGGSRNVISGNTDEGILILAPDPGVNSGDVDIFGNVIGLNGPGTAALGNGTGIRVQAANVAIGSESEGVGNLVSGNIGNGIVLEHGDADVFANFIGIGIDGSIAVSNGADGVRIQNSSGNQIRRNTIGHNNGSGVSVMGSGMGNAISQNSIFENVGLGIAIDEENVIPNDPGDADTGANGRQNHPVLTSAEVSGANGIIEGALDSAPDQSYTIDFYASDSCDPSGYGEGEQWLTSASVDTDAAGHAVFAATFPAGNVDNSDVVTATATDGNGSTSGFSQCLPVGTKAQKAGGIQFSANASVDRIFYGTCQPTQVTISVEVSDAPEEIGYVLLFLRLMDPKTGDKTGWSEGLTMLSAQGNKFYYELSVYDIPDYDKFEEAVLQYQFVAYDASQKSIGTSEVFGEVTVAKCGRGAAG